MSRSRSAAALLAALLAISPVMQPMAAYAEAQRQGELGAPVAALEDLSAKPQGALDAEEDPAEDLPLQTPPLPEDGEDRAALEQGAPVEEGAAEAREGLSDTPLSDQSMAYSWRYEAGLPVVSEPDSGGASFRSARVALPDGATAWGIDVSYANGPVDWKQVKRSGVDFAILRLGYGWGGDDAQFLNNVAGARANGIKIGVYLYSYAWDAASARREAQWTLQVLRKAGLKPSDLDLPVFYDIENVSKVSGKPAGVDDDNRYREITGGPAAFASMASAYCEVVKAAGYTPGVYSSTSWWETYLTSPVFDQWDRWVAQWNKINTYRGTYSTWQYTSSGKIAGIDGDVDLNYSFDPRFARPDTSGVRTTAALSGGVITASISGFSVPPSNIAFAVTTPAGSVSWHQAYRGSDGSWRARINLSNVFDRAGSYRVMAYGTFGFYTYDLSTAMAQIVEPSANVSFSQAGGTLVAAASAWTVPPSNVAVMVTAPNGKVRWYQSVKGPDGTWTASVPASSDFGAYGTYAATIYATVAGRTAAYKTATVSISAPRVSTSLKSSGGALVAAANGWTLEPVNVAFRVDSPTGQTRWYQAYRQQDGSWTVSIGAVSDFGDWGSYTATTFATFAGKTKDYGSAAAKLSPGDIKTTASALGVDITLSVNGWTSSPSNVAFRVELPSGGVTWVQAHRQASGAWTAAFSAVGAYNQLGTYRATAFATFSGKTAAFGDVALAKASLGNIRVDAAASGASIALSVSGWGEAPTNVAFAVKSPRGQVKWIQAYRQPDGSWRASTSAADFKEWGVYRATAHATIAGSTVQVGSDSVQVDPGDVKIATNVSNSGDVTAIVSGWRIAPSNVAFEVRLPSGAVKWFQAIRQPDGSWKMGISISRELREWGSYRIAAYATVAGWTSAYGSATARYDIGDVRASAAITGGGVPPLDSGSQVLRSLPQTPPLRSCFLRADRDGFRQLDRMMVLG